MPWTASPKISFTTISLENFRQGGDDPILVPLGQIGIQGQDDAAVLQKFAHRQWGAEGQIPVGRLPVGAHHPTPRMDAAGQQGLHQLHLG